MAELPIKYRTFYDEKLELWVSQIKVSPYTKAFGDTKEESIAQLEYLIDYMMEKEEE